MSRRARQKSAHPNDQTPLPVSFSFSLPELGKDAEADFERRSTDVLEAEAQKREVLVPITIDFDVASPDPDRAGIKIKDRFLWNLNGESPVLLLAMSRVLVLTRVQRYTFLHTNSRASFARIQESPSIRMRAPSRTSSRVRLRNRKTPRRSMSSTGMSRTPMSLGRRTTR